MHLVVNFSRAYIDGQNKDERERNGIKSCSLLLTLSKVSREVWNSFPVCQKILFFTVKRSQFCFSSSSDNILFLAYC